MADDFNPFDYGKAQAEDPKAGVLPGLKPAKPLPDVELGGVLEGDVNPLDYGLGTVDSAAAVDPGEAEDPVERPPEGGYSARSSSGGHPSHGPCAPHSPNR